MRKRKIKKKKNQKKNKPKLRNSFNIVVVYRGDDDDGHKIFKVDALVSCTQYSFNNERIVNRFRRRIDGKNERYAPVHISFFFLVLFIFF